MQMSLQLGQSLTFTVSLVVVLISLAAPILSILKRCSSIFLQCPSWLHPQSLRCIVLCRAILMMTGKMIVFRSRHNLVNDRVFVSAAIVSCNWLIWEKSMGCDLLANRCVNPFEYTFNIELVILGVKIVRWIWEQSRLIVVVLVVCLVYSRIDRAEIVLQRQVETMLIFVVHLRLNRH